MASYDSSKKKKVLLVTHELHLTGAPVALFYLAEMLKKIGYQPVVISPKDGNLSEEYKKLRIPVIVSSRLYNDNILKPFINLFSFSVASTIVTAPFVTSIMYTGHNVIWWIHEAAVSYTPEFRARMPEILPKNISVYTGGEYAGKKLKNWFPKYNTGNLVYYVPKIKRINKIKKFNIDKNIFGKKIFLMVGTLEERKGFDILADAIFSLDKDVLEKSFFVFVGRKHYELANKKVELVLSHFPENSVYYEQLVPSELRKLYKIMDCLICASRDDPMPIVVTDALMFGKPVICSDNTGCASYIKKHGAGFLYSNNDVSELRLLITEFSKREIDVDGIRRAGNFIYHNYFSYEVFKRNVKGIIQAFEKYSGPSEFEEILMNFYDNKLFGDEISGSDILVSYGKSKNKKVVLISHEFSLTGAPVVLNTFAIKLKKLGYDVLVLSPSDGKAKNELKNNEIPYIVYSKLASDDFLDLILSKVDLIVLNTVVDYQYIPAVRRFDKPVIWWIHDSEASYTTAYFDRLLPRDLSSNFMLYFGGEYAEKQFLRFYPEYRGKTKILLYYSEDHSEDCDNNKDFQIKRENKIVFTVLGQQIGRKGHDIFAKAIDMLTDIERNSCLFYFIGSPIDPLISNYVDSICKKYPNAVYHINEVSRDDLFTVYSQTDCIVCPSRDDPLPVFVTESLMMSKNVICSENTGSAPIIEKYNCGFVYHNNSEIELAECIRKVIKQDKTLIEQRINARKAYLENFSEKAFSDSVDSALSLLKFRNSAIDTYPGVISVIVPTYNAGKQFGNFVEIVKKQKYIYKVELVVVDSGSTDETCKISEESGATLIRIKNTDFSHSYARNLGASKAKGDIIVFMTQDALPSSENWLFEMIKPVALMESVAVSCKECCPESTDLYYKIASKLHSSFLEIENNDRLCKLSAQDEFIDIRKKGALNDISVAIDKRIFLKYGYRFNYAEDLDLGLRLIEDGYTIKFLSSNFVIHGHNRSVSYYVKRGYVESLALEKINKNFKVQSKERKSVCYDIVLSFINISNVISDVRKLEKSSSIRKSEIISLLSKDVIATSKLDSVDIGSFNLHKEELFNKLLHCCYSELNREIYEISIFYGVEQYIKGILIPYISEFYGDYMLVESVEEICQCILKQFAVITGNILGAIDRDDSFIKKLEFLKVGV